MCVIVFKPEKKKVAPDVLKKCYQANTHGCGCYATNGSEFHIVKQKEYDDFIKEVEKFNTPEWTTVFHFRISTSGGVNVENIHPFQIKDDMYLFHNGIISKLNGKSQTKCDTWLLADALGKMKYDISLIEKLIEPYTNDKFVIISKEKYSIINEEVGSWKDGIWFSNTSWDYNYTSYTPKDTKKKDKYPEKLSENQMLEVLGIKEFTEQVLTDDMTKATIRIFTNPSWYYISIVFVNKKTHEAVNYRMEDGKKTFKKQSQWISYE